MALPKTVIIEVDEGENITLGDKDNYLIMIDLGNKVRTLTHCKLSSLVDFHKSLKKHLLNEIEEV